MIYTKEITAVEEKILLSEMADIKAWIDNVISERIRHAAINCIEEYTEKNPRKLDQSQMITELTNINIKTAKEKSDELISPIKLRGR